MANLGIYDFMWVRGTTLPLIVSMQLSGSPIPYDDIRLSVFKGKNLAFRLTLEDNEGTGPGTVEITGPGIFKFTPTADQTRSLAQTPNDGSIGKNSYEVEIRDGVLEAVYLLGTIAAIGGLNDFHHLLGSL